MGTGKKQTDQMIEVDARKLAQGLKAAFAGMAMVFDSIGVETDIEAEEKAGGKTARRSSTATVTAAAAMAISFSVRGTRRFPSRSISAAAGAMKLSSSPPRASARSSALIP